MAGVKSVICDILMAALPLYLLSLCACSVPLRDENGTNPNVSKEVEIGTRSKDEEYEVLAAVFRNHGSSDSYVVSAQTYADMHRDIDAAKSDSFMKGCRPDTLTDFTTKNYVGDKSIRTEVAEKFGPEISVILISTDEIRELWNFKETSATENWKKFKLKFGAEGYFTVSRVGFSEDGSQALIFANYTCGTLCADGTYYLLNNQNGSWAITGKKTVWVS